MTVRYHEGKFPPRNLDWERLAAPLAKASDALARYDSFLSIIPDSGILVSPMMVQEAVTSSKIEGTRATASDVLMYEAAGGSSMDPSKRDDVREVVNYRIAVRTAQRMLADMPLTGRVLKAAHAELLSGVRGQLKSPGAYRTDQNWIGTTNDIRDARYIPISAAKLPEAMAAWERFVNTSGLPSLVKISIAHAEFESIHPFLDGNGRIGRMMVPLMLCSDGIISYPCFYLSEFFEHRNDEYQDRLLAVSEDDDWTGWCEFFLRAIETQARENTTKAHLIFELRESVRRELSERSKSSSADKVTDSLFDAAIFPATRVTHIDGVAPKTGRRLLGVLREMGVVVEAVPRSGRSPAVYVFPRLLEITEGTALASGSPVSQ